jgi:hypothetical protein
LIVASGFRSIDAILANRTRLVGAQEHQKQWAYRLIRFMQYVVVFPVLVLVVALRAALGNETYQRFLVLMLVPLWYFFLFLSTNYAALTLLR